MSLLFICIMISQQLSASCPEIHKRPVQSILDYSDKYLSLSRNVLWVQIPDTVNAWNMACQLDSVYPFNFDVADDIMVADSAWEVDTVITWWWNWHGFISWSLVPNIHFLVFPDSTSGGPCDSSIIDITVEQGSFDVYEYVTGERWRLEMALPSLSPVLLPSGRHWIEVRPSCVFYDNGQTGIISEVGCGNGYEAWCRYPTISHYYWGPATYWFGVPYEMGFILIGNMICGVQENIGNHNSIVFSFINDLPNPISGRTRVSYVTKNPGWVLLKVYNSLGQEINLLVNEYKSAGVHTNMWETVHLPDGTYFLKLESTQEQVIRKVVVIH